MLHVLEGAFLVSRIAAARYQWQGEGASLAALAAVASALRQGAPYHDTSGMEEAVSTAQPHLAAQLHGLSSLGKIAFYCLCILLQHEMSGVSPVSGARQARARKRAARTPPKLGELPHGMPLANIADILLSAHMASGSRVASDRRGTTRKCTAGPVHLEAKARRAQLRRVYEVAIVLQAFGAAERCGPRGSALTVAEELRQQLRGDFNLDKDSGGRHCADAHQESSPPRPLPGQDALGSSAGPACVSAEDSVAAAAAATAPAAMMWGEASLPDDSEMGMCALLEADLDQLISTHPPVRSSPLRTSKCTQDAPDGGIDVPGPYHGARAASAGGSSQQRPPARSQGLLRQLARAAEAAAVELDEQAGGTLQLRDAGASPQGQLLPSAGQVEGAPSPSAGLPGRPMLRASSWPYNPYSAHRALGAAQDNAAGAAAAGLHARPLAAARSRTWSRASATSGGSGTDNDSSAPSSPKRRRTGDGSGMLPQPLVAPAPAAGLTCRLPITASTLPAYEALLAELVGAISAYRLSNRTPSPPSYAFGDAYPTSALAAWAPPHYEAAPPAAAESNCPVAGVCPMQEVTPPVPTPAPAPAFQFSSTYPPSVPAPPPTNRVIHHSAYM